MLGADLWVEGCSLSPGAPLGGASASGRCFEAAPTTSGPYLGMSEAVGERVSPC
jgi:hypothetical protein